MEPKPVPPKGKPSVGGNGPDIFVDRKGEGVKRGRAILDFRQGECAGLQFKAGAVQQDVLPDAARLADVAPEKVKVARAPKERGEGAQAQG